MGARRALFALLVIHGVARAQPEEEPPPPPEPEVPEKATTGVIEGTVESPELESPLAGAKVSIVGTAATTTTDDAGKYRFEDLKPGEITLSIELEGFATVERKVTVVAGETVTLAIPLSTVEAPQLEETIIVVGSRTPRTKTDSPVPVDVLTAEDLARTGRTETGRILHTLAPSFISTPQSVADGSDHIDPASLRGLGPDQVLILVNGRRRHRTALMHVNGTFGRGTVGTDLNAIAAHSIKRIEILRDGAASQYGSDAIAGVINIVTKDVTDLLDVTSQTGITASRDGAQLKTGANYGFKIGEKGFINVTGEFLQREATNRAGTYTGTIYSDDGAMDDAQLNARGLTREDFDMKIGEAWAIAGIGAFNLEVPFSNKATFYSFGDVAHRRGRAAGFYRFPKQVAQNVPEFFPDGFLPEIHPVIDDRAITVGLRRKGTWNVDASLTNGRNSFQFNIEDSVNASLGTSSPTTFDAGSLFAEQSVANLDLLHQLDQDVVEKVSLVFGSELRIENYRIEAGDEASYTLGTETVGNPPVPKAAGAQVFPGFQPSNEVDRTRESIGIYAGVESELTKRVLLDVGGRYESYSDFGQSVIGKIAARVKLPGGITTRGGVGTGFRAPSLQQLWFSNVSTQFLNVGGTLTPTQVLTSNNQSPVTRAFGIPRLQEERSVHASGGVSFHPTENFTLSADAYFIRLRDRIVLTSQFTNANPIVADILSPFPGVSQAQFFANAVDTDTVGGDIVGDYSVDAGDGTLTLTGGVNFTKTEVKRVNIPASLRQRFGSDPMLETFFFGRLARNRLEDAVPHQKATAAVRYAISGVSALVRANYYGKVFFKPDDPANDESFGAKVLFDVDVGYQATKNVFFAIGADNVLDTFPDKQRKEANISSGRFLYSRNVSQFGQNGGFYYAKLQLTFF